MEMVTIVKKPRIAILGAGVTGLSCALECERNGVYPEIFERDFSIGWVWPSVTYWPDVFTREKGDMIQYLSDKYDIGISYLSKNKEIIMKSSEKEIKIKGDNLGYFIERGKRANSLENQMFRHLTHTAIHYNRPADYKELSQKYDYVVIATGKTTEAANLGVWQELDKTYIYGGIAVGNFNPASSIVYFDTEYAGTGYARVTPINSTQALVAIYVIGMGDVSNQLETLFDTFLIKENLKTLEFIYYIKPPTFPVGRVSQHRIGNVFLGGRSAGLTERVLGVGGYDGIMSGILAARSIINGEDYDTLMKPLKEKVETISSFREVVNKFDNKDFDKLITVLKTPGLKQLIYNTGINFTDIGGKILKALGK